MSLFKFSTADVAYFAKGIYIPIYLYLNRNINKSHSQKFTFQYVSILIPLDFLLALSAQIFTFQYVSILMREKGRG